MISTFPQKLSSDQIRKGLMNIRNSQAQLLNQLKNETNTLRKYSPPFAIIEQPDQCQNKYQMEDCFPTFVECSPGKVQQNSKSRIQSSKYNEHRYATLIDNRAGDYLSVQNQKNNNQIKRFQSIYEAEKDRVNDLEEYISVTSKLYYKVIDDILDEIAIKDVKFGLINSINNYHSIFKRRRSNQFDKIVKLLQSKENIYESKKIKAIEDEQNIGNHLNQLKNQLNVLVKANLNRAENQIMSEQQISKLKQDSQNKRKQFEVNLQKMKKIELDNKELVGLWEREKNERKKNIIQCEKLKKQIENVEEKEKKIIFFAKNMEDKYNRTQKLLKDREKIEEINQQNLKKLNDTVGLLREDNERLRQQMRNIEQSKQRMLKQSVGSVKQIEIELKLKIQQQQIVIRNLHIQLNSLQTHLAEVKSNAERQLELQARRRESQSINWQLYHRKLQILRTNSHIDHLWQVKQVQYQNINNVLNSLKKSIK